MAETTLIVGNSFFLKHCAFLFEKRGCLLNKAE